MNANEVKLMAFFATNEKQALRLLERIVNIDSKSRDKAGVDAVGEALAEFLQGYGITTQRLPLEKHGDLFRAELRNEDTGPHVLLMGHRDTVFPAGEAARRPFRIENGRAYGPGVADMKAGLMLNALVMAAFAELKLPHPPIVTLYTGDEEIGSPSSRPGIEEVARGARVVFNAEPGRVSGNVVIARRAGVFFKAKFTGRAAHAGIDYEYGRSAILALARKTEAWTALTDPAADVTVNVGLIAGGQSVNTVAPWATCEIDLRYGNPSDRDKLVEQIMEVARTESVPDTQCDVEIAGEFLPMLETEAQSRMLSLYCRGAADAGLSLTGEYTRSCADSGITASLGIPTICATGPVGGRAHSPEEYIELSSVVPRMQALALTIFRLAQPAYTQAQ